MSLYGFILNPYVVPMEAMKADPVLGKTKIMKHQEGFQNVARRFLKGDEGCLPVHPPDRIVLAIDVVIPILRIPELISRQDAWRPLRARTILSGG